MGKHGQLVMGPAGSGKSTYCDVMVKHCENIRRTIHVVNLDPAAENFKYHPTIDIRDLIETEDVVDQFNFGPNGALVYCLEYLVQNLNWLRDQLGDYEDDYLLFDCPGQIELYTHLPVMLKLVTELTSWGYSVCALHLIDSHFISDSSKFLAGTLISLSAMVHLQLPHINIITKLDLLNNQPEKKKLLYERYCEPDIPFLINELNQETGERFYKLNQALGNLIQDYNMVSFLGLDISDPDSIGYVLAHIDNSIQYGEDLEVGDTYPQEKDDDEQANFGQYFSATRLDDD